MRTGWQYRICEQGGNVECANRGQYKVCEHGGNIKCANRVAI